MLIDRTTVVEGGSRVFSLRVREGSGYADLTGYTLTGRLRSPTSSSPTTITGALNLADSTEALYGLTAAMSASKGGTVYDLELEAANGGAVHKKLWRVEFLKVWPHDTSEILTGSPIDNETPTGTADGVNATFGLAFVPDPTASLDFYVNGALMTQGTDYTLSGATVTFLAGSIPPAAATLLADYRVGASGSITTVVRYVDDETPAGTMNGVNTTFTLARTPVTGSVKLWWNGVRQVPGTHYTISGTTITFLAGYEPDTGDTLNADYRY